MGLALGGAAIGLIGAVAMSRLLPVLLFGVSAAETPLGRVQELLQPAPEEGTSRHGTPVLLEGPWIDAVYPEGIGSNIGSGSLNGTFAVFSCPSPGPIPR